MESSNVFKGLDKSLRKQRILDTAARVFHQKGYRTATLDDVAQELGLTKAALYHYFSSKEDLLSAIYIQALENFFAKAYEIGALGLPPREKLRLLVRNHIQGIIIENLPMFAVFFSEENQLPEKDFQRIRLEKRKYTQVVVDIIEEGIAGGAFRKLDSTLMAHGIIGMCNWIYKWYRPDRAGHGPEAIADLFLELLEMGYVASEEGIRVAPASGARAKGKRLRGSRQRLMEDLKKQSRALVELIEALERVR
jgi:AcrR family transcriptional regulator